MAGFSSPRALVEDQPAYMTRPAAKGKILKLLRFSLTFILLVSLAAALVDCSSAAPSAREPEPEASSVHSLPRAAQPEVEEGTTVAPTATAGPRRTPIATSETVKRSQVSATAGYRPEPVSSPIPSITPAIDPALTTLPDSLETPPPGAEESPRPESGYVLTAGQGNHEGEDSNTDPAVGNSGGIVGSSGSASVSGQADPVEGQPYTWQDGDRTLTALLQSDLTVGEDGKISPLEDSEDTVVARGISGDVDRKVASSADSGGQPVFRSESGQLMTLPGGVLLALDPELSQTETDAIFASNGINLDRVSELEFLTNGYFVETEPGFPSLNLANALAGQDGVMLSSPNWWAEISPE